MLTTIFTIAQFLNENTSCRKPKKIKPNFAHIS